MEIVRIWLGRLLGILLVGTLTGLGIAAATMRFEYAPMPAETALLNPVRLPLPAFDLLGRPVSAEEADRMAGTEDGRKRLTAEAGAVRIDADLVSLGRDAFYRETFGNELFLSEVLGILDGAVAPGRLALAILDLGPGGTDDLAVTLDRDVAVGDRTFRAGDSIPTGLSVLPGEYVPLGLRTFYDRGRVRVGITCALCHARFDMASGKVIEGAPNARLRLGLLLALSANPSAVFAQTGISAFGPYLQRPENIVRTSAGPSAILPDPATLASDVRPMLSSWPPGSADLTFDRTNDPTAIPTLFVAGAHPYGWSGQASLGPFRGLAAMAGDMHGFAIDPTARAGAAPSLFGIDPEVYLGASLQRAPGHAFRFEPWEGRKPSEILTAVDPDRGTPGLTRLAALPIYPLANYATLNGLVPARAGEPIGRVMAALSAFMSTLRPPDIATPADAVARGRAVFEKAGCLSCHSGTALTSNRIWPAAVIGSEPSRARAFAVTELTSAKPQIFAPDTPWPARGGGRLLDLPLGDEGQLKLAWGYNRTGGGYKVPGLVGLAWRAPYLHDGGVAVGPDPEQAVGSDALAAGNIVADPRNSLRALLDRTWRDRVTTANRASDYSGIARVTGRGHTYWVDQAAGFEDTDREALITFLLSIDRPMPPPASASAPAPAAASVPAPVPAPAPASAPAPAPRPAPPPRPR